VANDEAKDPELDRLRSENAKLRSENRALRRGGHAGEKPKSLRRIFLEALAGGSLATAAIGGGYQVAADLFDDEEVVCARAHAAIQAPRLNQDLSELQRKNYMTDQYRIVEKCAKGGR